MSQIELKELNKVFKQGLTPINACDSINVKINKGEFVAIIGPSGSGKSTLLQLLGGLDSPTSGEIAIDGHDIVNLKQSRLTEFRLKNIGFIFQHFNLIPTLTAEQNVESAISKRSRDDTNLSRKMLASVGLESRAKHLPSRLSGGEQQRVAIARSLVNNPKLILADEPTGNLDSKTGTEIMDLLAELNKSEGRTIIVVTHSSYVRKLADRLFEMNDGRLVESDQKY